jgi:hypothetical protein
MWVVVCIAMVAAACVTDKQYNRAIFKVEAAWKEANEQILETEGKRLFTATKQQCFMASQMTANRLGMVVEQQSYDTGYLFVSGPAPTPLTMDEWAMVQRAETDNLRELIRDDLGVVSYWVELDPSGKDVLANIFITEKEKGTEVSVGLRLRSTGSKSGKKKRLQPPPTALHIGLSKFWAAFEMEMATVLSKYGVSGQAATASRPVRKPSVPVAAAAPAGVRAKDNPDAIAVIIGNRNYGGSVPAVEFAHNDADAMRRYMITYLGVSERNVIELRDAKLADMESVLGNTRSHQGKLWRWVRPEESDVFIYYSGHGIPGLKDGRRYLLPVDGSPDTPELKGYPLELLYSNLEKLDAHSVTVFLDACFSGESPSGPLSRKASGIRVIPKAEPVVPFTVLSAASRDQMASWDEEANHGLFTKHLLDALHGAADGKRYGKPDGRITLSEIKSYLDREMTYAARRKYGRNQEATVIGDSEKVIVTLSR